MLPPSLRDWLSEDHRVFRVLEVVEQLDLGAISEEIQSKDARGTRPYNPRMMIGLLVYAYCEGIYSSRKIARAAVERVPFRVLTANQAPHFTVINRFRDRHRRALPGLFSQVVLLCRRLGLVDFGHVAIDGTKLQASASKHKAMSYRGMKKELSKLEKEIEEMLGRAQAEDEVEDARWGEGRDVDDLPDELKRREDRIERIREAMTELEKEAKKAKAADLRRRSAEQEKKATEESDEVERKRQRSRSEKSARRADELDSHGEGETQEDQPLPRHRVEALKDGSPSGRAQRNFTDPESRIMCRNKEYLQGYNAQIIVDSRQQIVVAAGLSNQAPDQEYLIPMLERLEQITDTRPTKLSADAGYMSANNAGYCEDRQIDAYIATSRKSGSRKGVDGASNKATLREWETMTDKLKTAEGAAVYSKRKTIVEPVFGQIREARGFRRFSFRGLAKAESEWILVTLCHNVLKLVKAREAFSLMPT